MELQVRSGYKNATLFDFQRASSCNERVRRKAGFEQSMHELVFVQCFLSPVAVRAVRLNTWLDVYKV